MLVEAASATSSAGGPAPEAVDQLANGVQGEGDEADERYQDPQSEAACDAACGAQRKDIARTTNNCGHQQQ